MHGCVAYVDELNSYDAIVRLCVVVAGKVQTPDALLPQDATQGAVSLRVLGILNPGWRCVMSNSPGNLLYYFGSRYRYSVKGRDS